MGELITATEAARRYAISEKTIRTWIQRGKLPAKKIEGDGLDHWQIDTDEIELAISRKNAGKHDIGLLPDVFARLEALESRLDGIEKTLSTMTTFQQQKPSTPIIEPSRDIRVVTQPLTHPLQRETTLPLGYRGFTEFFKSHGIAETTANRAANAGIFQVLTNGWKVDGVSVRKVLDPEAQRFFCLHFRSRSTGFHECGIDDCPCQQIIGENHEHR